METVTFLAPIAGRACHLEGLEANSVGEFLRILSLSSGLDDDGILLLFEHIIRDLVESELLESCEFHEALDGLLPVSHMTELLIGAFSGEHFTYFAPCLSKLCGGNVFKPGNDEWRMIRNNMSAVDFRKLIANIVENTCDKPHQIQAFLLEVFGERDEFDLTDTLRIILESNWILDILPQKRKAARLALTEYFAKPIPSTAKVVGDFCRDMLQLSPLQERAPAGVSDASVSSSSDSDVESRGSLDDFVVDSDEDEIEFESDEDSESQVSSASSESMKLKRKKRRYSSSSSSSGSDPSGKVGKRKPKGGKSKPSAMKYKK
jgi:hypothetical protein